MNPHFPPLNLTDGHKRRLFKFPQQLRRLAAFRLILGEHGFLTGRHGACKDGEPPWRF